MRAMAGALIFSLGVALGFAWTQRPTRPPAAVLEVFLEPTGSWDDGEPSSNVGSAETSEPAGTQRLRVALTLTADVAELIGRDLARGEPDAIRALVDSLAELPWEHSGGVFRAVLLDPLLHPSLRVYGVEELGRAGAVATPLLRDLLAREEDQALRTVIEQSLAAARGVGGTGHH